MKRYRYLRDWCFRLGGNPPTYDAYDAYSYDNDNNEDDEEGAGTGTGIPLDLVTIISDHEILVRGAIDDRVRYEILCEQMRRIRNTFSFVAIFVVVLSIPAMLISLYLKDSYNNVMHETNSMARRLGTAGESMDIILGERNDLLQLNSAIRTLLESSSVQDCFDTNALIDAASDLSFSLEYLSSQMEILGLQNLRQVFIDAHAVASDVETSLQSFAQAIWVLISSILVLDLSSLTLYIGTAIARRNSYRHWHHVVFQYTAFPILISASVLLLLAFILLKLTGILSVDFCSSAGNPTNAVLAILDANGYDNTAFYDAAEGYMQVRSLNLYFTRVKREKRAD